MVGRIAAGTRPVPVGFQSGEWLLVLLGPDAGQADGAGLGGSELLRMVTGTLYGPCPRVDLDLHQRLIRCLIFAADHGLLGSANDCSMGGLAVAVAEGILLGNEGISVELDVTPLLGSAGAEAELAGRRNVELFAELPSRVVVTVRGDKLSQLQTMTGQHGLPMQVVGKVQPVTDSAVAGLTIVGSGTSIASVVSAEQLHHAYNTLPWLPAM
jgi:phosphoribosylformylglycinamidine synthase